MNTTIGSNLVSPVYTFYADDGVTPLAGGTITNYLAGGTTKADFYQNAGLSSAHQNPATLDSDGKITMYFSPINGTNEAVRYKWDVKDADGVSISGYPIDSISVPAASAGANLSTAVVGYGASTTLTIAGGVITPTLNRHMLSPEGGTVDDLVTINTSGLPDGALLVLGNANGSAAITVKNGTGNIFLATGDYLMATTTQRLVLIRQASNWYSTDPPQGTGDVVGPSAAADGAIATYDGTSGKLIKNSAAYVESTGALFTPAGGGSALLRVGGTIASNITQVSNVNAGETTLYSLTIPASTLNVDGQSVTLEAFGDVTNNGDTKTLRIKWGGVTQGALDVTTTGGFFALRVNIMRASATVQYIGGYIACGPNTTTPFWGAGAVTLSGSTTLVITGQGVSSSQIILRHSLTMFNQQF